MAGKAPAPLEVELTHTKETKGTHVYANAQHEINLYFPKSLPIFKGEAVPETITMTLKVK